MRRKRSEKKEIVIQCELPTIEALSEKPMAT